MNSTSGKEKCKTCNFYTNCRRLARVETGNGCGFFIRIPDVKNKEKDTSKEKGLMVLKLIRQLNNNEINEDDIYRNIVGLIDSGADLTVQDKDGNTAWDSIASGYIFTKPETLLNLVVEVNGRTPLWDAHNVGMLFEKMIRCSNNEVLKIVVSRYYKACFNGPLSLEWNNGVANFIDLSLRCNNMVAVTIFQAYQIEKLIDIVADYKDEIIMLRNAQDTFRECYKLKD